MAQLDEAEQYDNVLDDDALAPLKRNHACLQCKKRKVKCDAVKPSCSPCMRSHAHAVRAATRNGTAIPTLTCTYTDGDLDDDESTEGPEVGVMRKDSAEKKKTVKRPGVKAGVIGTGPGAKAKEKKLEDERDVLKIRIAELERKLAAQTPSTTASSISADPISNMHKSSFDGYQLSGMPDVSMNGQTVNLNTTNGFNDSSPFKPNQGNTSYGATRVEEVFDQAWPSQGATNNYGGTTNNVLGGLDLDWDVGGLFMVPANWPMNLPSPFLLEHLIETFFNCVPQIPRMIHKGNLLYRVRLSPTHKDFPHAAQLHAICAIAAPHTAWVNSIPPEKIEETATRAISLGQNLEDIEDFGLAQAFAARRAMDQSATCCAMGSGHTMFQLVQAAIILAEVFFQKGMPLQGWIMAGTAPRLIKSLELGNRNHGFRRYKEPMLPAPKTAIEREERIATVWMAHIQDSGFALNSYWSQSMEWRELRCGLPTSTAEFRKKDPEFMLENPQSIFSQDALTEHPVPDTFILVVKASILMARSAKWLQEWHQREIYENDELNGLSWPSFIDLVQDIHAFQRSVPAATRNVFRILDQPSSGFDSNLLLIHILPNIALALIHEPFVDWKVQAGAPIHNIQKAYEAIMGMLHLIPSNLDVSLIMTPLLAFSMYTTGRVTANFMKNALELQNYGLAARHRADLSTVQSLLGRHGLKHTLGGAMSEYLNTYLRTGNEDPCSVKSIEANMCLDPEQSTSFPILSSTSNAPTSHAIANSDSTYSFQNNVQMDFSTGYQTQQGGIDMSTYLTQMSMSNTTNTFDNNNAFSAAGTGPGNKQEAHISPESYNASGSSYASSRNMSGSSKTTPESTGLVDPLPTYFNLDQDQNSVNMSTGGKGMEGFGQTQGQGFGQGQGLGQNQFVQMERYFDTVPNQDAKMY